MKHTLLHACLALGFIAQLPSMRAAETARTPDAPAAAAATSAATDPLGEWYAVGHCMALESLPSYRVLSIPDQDVRKRLTEVLSALGVKPDTQLKKAELKLLQQGWDDAIAGRSPAMTYPPEQPRSLMPPALRGFHKFQVKAPAGGSSDGQSLADKAVLWKKAVAKVIVGNTDKVQGHGTGFFIAPGLLVTNHHVVEGATKFAVQFEDDKSLHNAVLIAQQSVPDVALLRVDFLDNESLPIGISSACRELEEVIMIGYPQFISLSATYVKGSISSTNRTFEDCEVLQLDIRANQGNSGGPIITTDGRVVGILTFGLGAIDAKLSQFTYAIKIDSVLPFLNKYAKGKFTLQEP